MKKKACLLLLSIPCCLLVWSDSTSFSKINKQWDFRYKGFVIGAWWGPGSKDVELKLYKEAGFNVVMIGRYMQMDDYADIEKCKRELDLAQQHGLWVMFDTYTMNEHPWGGKAWQEPYPEKTHHPASLEELQFLCEKIGRHPALLGFLLGDDQGEVTLRTKDCTDFLFKQSKPHLIPWLCGWIPPKNLAEHNNPICDPQIYPPLKKWHLSADRLAVEYVCNYLKWSKECKKYGILFWPMFYVAGLPGTKFNYFPSDSFIRFPAYLSLAFGAKGIWYFHYGGGSIRTVEELETEDAVKSSGLSPVYEVVKEINNRISSWGDMVIDKEYTEIYGTAFREIPRMQMIKELQKPGRGKIIEGMDEDLIVGILEKKGKPSLAMVINCQVSKEWNAVPYREVVIYFSQRVKKVKIWDGDKTKEIEDNEVKFDITPGSGQLIEIFK